MSEYSSIAVIFITLGGDSLITVIYSIALDTSNAVLVDVTHGSLVFGTSVTYVPFKILTNVKTTLNIMYSSQVFFYGFQFDGGVVRIETVIDHPPILCREIIIVSPPDLSCNEYQPIRVSNLQFRNSMTFEPKNLDLIADDMITLEDASVKSSAIHLQHYVHYYFKPSLIKPTGLYTNNSLINNSLIELFYRNVLPDEETIQKNKNKRFWIQCSHNLSCYDMHYKLNIQTQMKFNFNYVCEKISEEQSCFGIYYKNSPREIDIDICYDAYGNYDVCKGHDFFFSHDNFSQWVNLLTRETETINFSISSSLTIALDFEPLKSEVDVTINSIADHTIDITLRHTKTLGTYIKCLNLSNVNLDIDPLDESKEFSIKQLSLLQESKLTENTYKFFNFSDVKLTIDMSELKDRHIDSFKTINCIIYHNFVIVRLTNSTVSFNTHSADTARLKNIGCPKVRLAQRSI
ncbi:hypothetical protein TVAG_119250 [Trichomonas vaginalis G3]|uniref:Uncharacterized protein n=1 Tax=Trichomonas vaginalis (strain ATCC PRA-98 / G3) TaxID=412133 RepID=A2D772_TRIV3|nr:hypothetical protein TVAG_119250 [Trichomonas vaginalis G3]|eukprot:XP_001276837.1 hypothetical protein [Trichomonas vaginalis G3]